MIRSTNDTAFEYLDVLRDLITLGTQPCFNIYSSLCYFVSLFLFLMNATYILAQKGLLINIRNIFKFSHFAFYQFKIGL